MRFVYLQLFFVLIEFSIWGQDRRNPSLKGLSCQQRECRAGNVHGKFKWKSRVGEPQSLCSNSTKIFVFPLKYACREVSSSTKISSCKKEMNRNFSFCLLQEIDFAIWIWLPIRAKPQNLSEESKYRVSTMYTTQCQTHNKILLAKK